MSNVDTASHLAEVVVVLGNKLYAYYVSYSESFNSRIVYPKGGYVGAQEPSYLRPFPTTQGVDG